MRLKLFNLQLFGEGGEGADGGSAVATGESEGVLSGVSQTDSDIPAFIPEKAKKHYRKAMERMNGQSESQSRPQNQTTNDSKTEERKSYAELIKSDEYKDEHKKYMDKTIKDRFKKYEGMEEYNGKAREILDIVAAKYGLDPNSETFMDELRKSAEEDDSYYEDYAMEHDITPSEARRIVTMQRKVDRIEAEKKAEAEREQAQQIMAQINANAERTKAMYPGFDLSKELENDSFRRMLYATNNDTTAAYVACHHSEIIPATVQMASRDAQTKTAMAIASGKNRPIENGTSSTASSVVDTDFRNMNLSQLRAYAEEQRRKQNGR